MSRAGDIDLSILIPARNSTHCLEETIVKLKSYLAYHQADLNYEILAIPNASTKDTNDSSYEFSLELAKTHPELKVVLHVGEPGKGTALRSGYLQCTGKRILLLDADLPFDLACLREMLNRLDEGFDFITANRRLKDSVFRCPVPFLPLVYRRHRLGLAFNRVARFLFQINSTDTQAGMKALSRRFADAAFANLTCPTFFYDLEFFITAHQMDYAHTDVPVDFSLNSEKTTVFLFGEFAQSAYWLPRIFIQNLFGWYGEKTAVHVKRRMGLLLACGAWTHRPATLLFLFLRWAITPYSYLSQYVPREGRVLDLGCGNGLFSTLLAMQSASRQVIGVDHDEARIGQAKQANRGRANLTYLQGDFNEGLGAPVDCITLLDSLHYLPFEDQKALVTKLYDGLIPGGSLLVREVNQNGGFRARLNEWYEKLATFTGFTRTKSKKVYLRTTGQWEELLRKQGFSVISEPCSFFLFSDVFFVCKKAGPAQPRFIDSLMVTADDWGLSAGINTGILDLIDSEMISRTSLMANSNFLGYRLDELIANPHVELGLHFDLTSGHGTPFASKFEFLRFLLNPFVPAQAKTQLICENLEKQLQKLERAGIKVKYVDSHHHIHLFGPVFDAFVGPLSQRGISKLRLPMDSPGRFFKRPALNLLSYFSQRKFQRSGFTFYPCFYPSAKDFQRPARLAYQLSHMKGHEVIVHPSKFDDLLACDARDSYQAGRVEEYNSLTGLFPIR